MDDAEETVTIPLKVYEGYKAATASLLAAMKYGAFDFLTDEQQEDLVTLTDYILDSGMLK